MTSQRYPQSSSSLRLLSRLWIDCQHLAVLGNRYIGHLLPNEETCIPRQMLLRRTEGHPAIDAGGIRCRRQDCLRRRGCYVRDRVEKPRRGAGQVCLGSCTPQRCRLFPDRRGTEYRAVCDLWCAVDGAVGQGLVQGGRRDGVVGRRRARGRVGHGCCEGGQYTGWLSRGDAPRRRGGHLQCRRCCGCRGPGGETKFLSSFLRILPHGGQGL